MPVRISFLFLAAALVAGQVHARTWTGAAGDGLAGTPGNWSPVGAPGSGDAIVLDGTSSSNLTWDAAAAHTVASWTQTVAYLGTVTVATVYGATGFTNFAISGSCTIDGGTWRHLVNTTLESYRLRVSVGDTFTLGTNAVINVDGLGYDKGKGPGSVGNASRSGGSYGGRGGWSPDGDASVSGTYGSFLSPTNIGSGGGTWGGAQAGKAGGAVWLTVGNATTIDGVTTATALEHTQGFRSGSTGGSIFLTTVTLNGSGTIRANGSTSGGGGEGGGGGGGRVAVILTAGATFGGVRMEAYGGMQSAAWDGAGAAGTVYLETSTQPAGQGTLLIGNPPGHRAKLPPITTRIPDNTTWNLYGLRFDGKGVLGLDSNRVLDIKADNVEGTTNSAGISYSGGGFVLSAGSITLSNCQLLVDAPLALTGDVRIASGGLITHFDNSTEERYKADLSVLGDLTIDVGGSINVDGLGYDPNNGPGTPPPDPSRCGGSYGGEGGQNGGYRLGKTYGSVLAPAHLGSGARTGPGLAGYGGGAAILSVDGATTVNGLITASGRRRPVSWEAGSAGGSVFLTTGSLSGSGTIQANGGQHGENSGPGGGGGGRIAVILTSGNHFDGVHMTAYGGTGVSGTHGAPGTVYRQRGSERSGRGTIVVDSDGIYSPQACVLPAATNAVVDELRRARIVVTNDTRLLLTNSMTVGDILVYTNAVLNLNGRTLTVHSAEHPLIGTVINRGEILWLPPSTLLLLR